MPAIRLASTGGGHINLARPNAWRTILYCYPRTGRPDLPQPHGWDPVAGARGCTPEACGFRDHFAELAAQRARVFGISTQDTGYQQEAVRRLGLPFNLLSDRDLEFARALRLPTFTFEGLTLLARLTLVVRKGHIEHVFYPVLHADSHAEDVLTWLAKPFNRSQERRG